MPSLDRFSLVKKALQTSSDVGYPSDPYLAVIPAFQYAMPVQVIMLGFTLCLLSLLLVHLLFTIRYHYPLSKPNYILQISAVLFLLAHTSVRTQVLMHILKKQSRSHPYMFDYIEVSIPPDSWNQGSRVGWLLLRGISSLAVHATHIQFLTMLFPSDLERGLIVGLLGPLALASAFLYFTGLSSTAAVNDLGDAIRNTANSSLTLLYTLALFIWGFAINRSRAWRKEGGTATFGALALLLGMLGTAVNFYEVGEDRLGWLPGVVYCILLWQSWLGFWWWVGAGMWTGEAEDLERRQAKKTRRLEAKRLKKEQRLARQLATSKTVVSNSSSRGNAAAPSESSMRRRGGRGTKNTTTAEGEDIELQDMNSNPINLRRPPISDESVSSGSTPPSSYHFYTPVFLLFSNVLDRLRKAHDDATVAKAALPPGLPEDVRRGWGIKAMTLRGRRERGERRAAVGAGPSHDGEIGAGERRSGFVSDGGHRLRDEAEWHQETNPSTHTREENSFPPRQHQYHHHDVKQDDNLSWTQWWKSIVNRHRVKDVSRF